MGILPVALKYWSALGFTVVTKMRVEKSVKLGAAVGTREMRLWLER